MVKKILAAILLISLSFPPTLSALSPEARARLQKTLAPHYDKLVTVQVLEGQEPILDQAVADIVEETVIFTEKETALNVSAVYQKKLRRWEQSVPWILTGGAIVFVGGLIVGLNVKN